MNKEWVQVTLKNANLPQVFSDHLKVKIENLRRSLDKELVFAVTIDVTGDHLYHLHCDVLDKGKNLFKIESQHNDPFTAADTLLRNLRALPFE